MRKIHPNTRLRHSVHLTGARLAQLTRPGCCASGYIPTGYITNWRAAAFRFGLAQRFNRMKILNCDTCLRPMKIGLGVDARDRTIRPWYCENCGKVHGARLASAATAIEWCQLGNCMARVITGSEQGRRDGTISILDYSHMQPCEVCGSTGTTEVHHWAPRHLFGARAEDWPTGHLCRICHVEWHQKVTPNMGQRRSAA